MKCNYCNTENTPGAQFCTNCGATLVPDTQSKPGSSGYGQPYSTNPFPGGAAAGGLSPKYVGFGEAIQLFFKNYVNFRGRSTRSEFWYAYLFQIIVNSVVGIIESRLDTSFLSDIVALAFLLPGMSLAFRRLHDIGQKGTLLIVQYVLAFVTGLVAVLAFGASITAGFSGSSGAANAAGGSVILTLILLLGLLGLSIYLIVLFCKPSQPTPNQYGRAPY